MLLDCEVCLLISHGNFLCSVAIMEGDPHPGTIKGRMSFQNFNRSVDASITVEWPGKSSIALSILYLFSALYSHLEACLGRNWTMRLSWRRGINTYWLSNREKFWQVGQRGIFYAFLHWKDSFLGGFSGKRNQIHWLHDVCIKKVLDVAFHLLHSHP